jgi:hypothetical protein
MDLVRRYDGRLIHVQTLSGLASGTTVGTPVIQVYEVQPASTQAVPPDPQSVALPERAPVRREFIYASYALAIVIASTTIVIAAVGGTRSRRR